MHCICPVHSDWFFFVCPWIVSNRHSRSHTRNQRAIIYRYQYLASLSAWHTFHEVCWNRHHYFSFMFRHRCTCSTAIFWHCWYQFLAPTMQILGASKTGGGFWNTAVFLIPVFVASLVHRPIRRELRCRQFTGGGGLLRPFLACSLFVDSSHAGSRCSNWLEVWIRLYRRLRRLRGQLQTQ